MQKEITRHQDLPYFPTQIQPTSVWTRRLCRRPTECSPWYQCECRWGLRSSCHWLLLIHHILQNMRFCLLKWFQVPPQQQKIVQVWIRTATYSPQTYVSKYDAILCGGHFHIGFDVGKVMRSQCERRWFLNQFKITWILKNMFSKTCTKQIQ